jgi:hypothetical protein
MNETADIRHKVARRSLVLWDKAVGDPSQDHDHFMSHTFILRIVENELEGRRLTKTKGGPKTAPNTPAR